MVVTENGRSTEMTAQMAGVRVEGRTGREAHARDGRVLQRQIVGVALVVAILVAMVIGGLGLYDRGQSHPAAPAILSAGAGTLQDYDYQVMQQERLFEGSMITPPLVVTVASPGGPTNE